jgi:Subtilase family
MRRRIPRQPISRGLLLVALSLVAAAGAMQYLPAITTDWLTLCHLTLTDAWAGGKESQRFDNEMQGAGAQAQLERSQAQTPAAFTRSESRGADEQQNGRQNGSSTQQSQYQGRIQDQEDNQRSSNNSPAAGKSSWQPDRDGRPGSTTVQDRDAPPATVLELIKRIVNPAPRRQAEQLSSPSSFGAKEVLAIGLTSSGLAKARRLGFGVGPSNILGQLGSRLTLLIPPAGMDVLNARDVLRSEVSTGVIGLNYIYRPYRSATGERGEQVTQRTGIRRATFGGCDAARCYGPRIIQWQPHLQSCARDIRVGVIDTFVDGHHPAFTGRNIHFGSFLANGSPTTVDGHGTGVLALLAGNPNSGTPGLIPDAEFYAADVYHGDENGWPAADTVSLLRALDWMGDRNVNIINMSMSGPHDAVLEKAIAGMAAKGILFVAAAGNEGPTAPPSYPAAYAPVIAVTAVGRDLRSYGFANHGDYIDFAAPGVGIWTALPGQLEGFQTGTSFAAPYVTAILAAIHGDVRERTKEAFVRSLTFRDLGQTGRDRIYGRGLVLAPVSCGPGQRSGKWITQIEQARPNGP